MISTVKSPIIFFMVLSTELSAFMMPIVDGRFAYHIMNIHWRPGRQLHNVDSLYDVFRFAATIPIMKNINVTKRKQGE